MKGKLQEYALIAEIVSAAAIVLSLVFVGLQIRDNTRASEATMYQNSLAYNIENLLAYGEDPATARVMNAFTLEDSDGLTEDETAQAMYLFTATYRTIENLYLQYEAGMISEEGWESLKPLTDGLILSPGFEKLYASSNALFLGGPFREYAQRILAEPQ